MMLRLAEAEIGGAVVRRTFTMSGTQVRRGDELTREQVLSIGRPNRQALIDKNFLDVFPLSRAAPVVEAEDRHVVSLGFGKFDVVEGRKLNDAPLTKDQAQALAGIEIKAPKPKAAKGRRN